MEQFVVSARKYRPATFASVVGQKHITSTLKNAIERNQLAHAYLFCGPRGVGKTTCARIFAKAINCLHPVGAEACNECDSCRSFNEGRSLNIHELDAASNNSVEDIRNLIEQVRVIPQIGHYSVFIIDEVHMLSQAAFNAFLKTLEEPPQHAIFILATTEKHKIIPTILSRCQIYDFNRIRVEDAVDYLRYIANNEGVSADEESLNLIAQKADGGMRDALSMFDKAVSFCGTSLEYRSVAQTLNVLDYDTYFRFTEMLAKGDYVNALLEFDRVLSKGFSGQIFMNGLNQHFRDLLVAKGPAVSLIEYTGTLMERYRTQAAACEPNFLFGAISLLSEADGKLRTASNQRLLVELTLMKIAVIGQKKNSGLSLPVEENYPLPNLNEARQGAAQSGVVASAVPSAPNTVSNVTPNVTPVAPAQPVPQVQAPQEVIPVQVSVAREVAPQPTTQPQARPPQPQTQSSQSQSMAQESGARPRPQGRPRVSPLGVSLTSMLKEASATEEEGAAILYRVDAESQSKLTAAKDAILAEIGVRRPRFVVAFEQMRIEGNKIVLDAPSEVLRNEIVAERTEISDMIIEVARINGVIELEINIQEQEVKLRPIKLEDRLHHMERVVPLFKELRESLDFDVE